MRKKANYVITIMTLICIGVIGVVLIIHGHNSEVANANKDLETISQNVDTTQQSDEESQTNNQDESEEQSQINNQGKVDEQGQGNEDRKSGQSDIANESDLTNQDGQASSDYEGAEENNPELNAQSNSSDEVINDGFQHNDINIKEMIALVGEGVYNFDSTKVVTVSDPSSLYVLVNKKNDLPEDYVPDLVVPNVEFSFSGDNPKRQMRPEAATALEALLLAAKDNGHEIYACSGYRSYSKQKSIFQSNVNAVGEEAANQYSARPGQSEHQTGLAMDLTSQSVSLGLEESFGDTPEGIWLAANASEYGFIIRYPEGKEDITQYSYEPWHIRYVGKTLATYIYENGLTLDEFYENIANSK